MNDPIASTGSILRRDAATALAVLLACTALILSSLNAQETPSQEVSTRSVEPTFKVQAERNLVMVRVVVRNKKGETVDNLRQEDFQVFDRGKKQTIVQFSIEKPAPNAVEQTAEKPATKPPPPGTGAAEKLPPPTIPARRFVALYFDDVSTGFSGLVRTRDAAYHFLQDSLHPGDRVGSVYRIGSGTAGFYR